MATEMHVFAGELPIEREGVDRQGGAGHAYGPTTDEAGTKAFEERGREDRHQFRFIVSPEDAETVRAGGVSWEVGRQRGLEI